MILTVKAQRSFSQYSCEVVHQYSQTAFYLNLSESREVEIGTWKIMAGINRLNQGVEVSLKRIVKLMDATYQKEEKRIYPLTARTLPVSLEHSFGGKTDVFNMICYPRDPWYK